MFPFLFVCYIITGWSSGSKETGESHTQLNDAKNKSGGPIYVGKQVTNI